ncbi:hypothetical protein XI06_07340 [Bradyrhizobium sp. CCBAU 11434]|uniref:DUF6641 family protein n=1 Tax=Bradyrhizobium sp. CCBAU 11434 TaxID=1630885 RepID=UPI002304ECCB|nr:DUF6641 family protein [Bradyrhizobium sp. CCBAU 11434]MDA9520168.1 hypothetical protein [Bradyrhizobium sp. CCBAU 11434]
MSTSILKSLTFVPQPKPSTDPLMIKRERMIARLEDQKKLLADPTYQRRIKRWEKTEGGEKVLVEKPLRTSKWWQQDQSGVYVMTVKVGSKRIEFEKGKAAIVVGPLEKLPTVIDTLIKAVRTGELDSQLSEGKGPRPVSGRKAA